MVPDTRPAIMHQTVHGTPSTKPVDALGARVPTSAVLAVVAIASPCYRSTSARFRVLPHLLRLRALYILPSAARKFWLFPPLTPKPPLIGSAILLTLMNNLADVLGE